jgi:ParB/RepB/Spo0J family partition protein
MPDTHEEGTEPSSTEQVTADSAVGEAGSIPPERIQPNPRNPRQFFPQNTIEQLAESIAHVGVLVPVTVYHEPDDEAQTTHVLLDGERRWRAAKLIDLPEIPVWIIPKPDGVENTLRMFNIHILREEWPEIAVAWALEQLMEELDTEDVNELREQTGLSATRIRNIKRALRFPREWQDAVADRAIPFNLLVELDKAVLAAARKNDAGILGYDEERLREAFLNKYVNGVVEDVVDLRKVKPLIKTAGLEGYAGQHARDVFQRLVEDPDTTIDEAYEEGAAASVEIDRVIRDLTNMPGRLGHLLSTSLHPIQRQQVLEAALTLRDQLNELIAEFSDSDTGPGK